MHKCHESIARMIRGDEHLLTLTDSSLSPDYAGRTVQALVYIVVWE